jgi:hypothetical protein
MAGVFVWVAMSGNWDSRADLFPVVFSCARRGTVDGDVGCRPPNYGVIVMALFDPANPMVAPPAITKSISSRPRRNRSDAAVGLDDEWLVRALRL